MALRILWDKYETALLIDLYLRIEGGVVDKAVGIRQLSKELRKRAIDAGIEIDDVYRNENGIIMQLGKIERLMTRREGATKHNTKIFVDVVELYFSNKDQFDLILNEAKGVQPVESKQEKFFSWLSKKEPAFRMSDFFFVVRDLESFAQQKKLFQGSLFEISDPVVTGKLVSALEADRYLRSSRRPRIQNMVKLAKYYDEYMKSNTTTVSADQKNTKSELVDHREKISDQRQIQNQVVGEDSLISSVIPSEDVGSSQNEDHIVTIQPLDTEIPVTSERIPQGSQSESIVDFVNEMDYAFTRPVSITYFGDKFYESTWREVYVKTCFLLFEDYPDDFYALRDSDDAGSRVCKFVYSEVSSANQIDMAKISEGLYIEIDRNTTALIRRIKFLLDYCRIDYENVVIHYEMLQEIEISREGANTDTKTDKNENTWKVRKERNQFAEHLQKKQFSPSVVKGITSTIVRVSDYAIEHGFISESLFIITDYSQLKTIYDLLARDPVFGEINISKNKRYTSALSLLLRYRKKSEGLPKPVTIKTAPVSQETEKAINHPGCTEFRFWLMQNVPFEEINSYVNSLKRIGEYLIENGHETRNIFAIRGIKRLERIRKQLAADKLYRSKEGIDICRIDYDALDKYISFRKNDESSCVDKDAHERFASILRENFENGFRPTSIIDCNRFKQYYADTFGEELDKDKEDIVEILKKIGKEQGGRIFFREGTSQDDIIDDIQESIAKAFKDGLSCVYLSEVFAKYQDILTAELKVYNVDSLKELLCSTSYGEYLSSKHYFYLKDRYPDAQKDIQNLMQRSVVPLSYGEIYQMLQYIPMDIIKHMLIITSKMVNVAQETYFYAPNLPISASELKVIIELIHNQLQQKSFITDKELRCLIQKYCPSVAINTESFTTWGLRNALSVLLSDSFSFNGSIISEIGAEINMAQTFEDFCRSHETMSLAELKDFAKEMNTVIYWDSVYGEMVRTSQDTFIRKDLVHFDIAATDAILSDLLNGDYMPLKSIRLFLHFPGISIKWNAFVLESYVANYSKSFSLMHASYTTTDCCGAVVRKESEIVDFKDLVTDVLAHSNDWSTKNDALALLVDKGYLQRRRYSDIDAVTQEARVRRDSLTD